MNFLQLCRRVASKAGTVAGIANLTTVVGATNRLAQLTGAVSDAYVDIQNERNDWLWLNSRFTGTLTVGKNTYTAAELGVLRVARWTPDRLGTRTLTLYDAAIGRKDEGYLSQITYAEWLDRYDVGQHDNNRPTSWAIGPQGQLLFGNTPDKAYAIRGSYRLKPQVLALDTDTPEMPDEYHGVIVTEAIRILSRDDEAFQPLQVQSDEYARLRNALVREQAPDFDMFFGGTLA